MNDRTCTPADIPVGPTGKLRERLRVFRDTTVGDWVRNETGPHRRADVSFFGEPEFELFACLEQRNDLADASGHQCSKVVAKLFSGDRFCHDREEPIADIGDAIELRCHLNAEGANDMQTVDAEAPNPGTLCRPANCSALLDIAL